MARPRKPTKLLLLNGAAKRNPGRLAGRATKAADGTWQENVQPTSGLGDPPEYFDDDEKQRWADLVGIVPEGILTQMDRPSAELLCRLWARSRKGMASTSQERLLASLFGKFGLSPSERSRIIGQPIIPGKARDGNAFRSL